MADDFKILHNPKGIKLDAKNIKNIFTGFCSKLPKA
tara:strand:- start:738 stop:845 length:108 start_codon:yes stop_codon:yes gene_type:complete